MSTPQEILTRLNPGKYDASRATRFDIERAKGALQSDLGITRLLNFDEETRTADFAFATSQPIEHWFGMLELDVSKKAVDLTRVEAGVCPFLVNHNRNDQVGVVVPGSVKLGDVIRGQVKFSRSPRGEEILNDVKDEIRNGTSIGLLINDIELTNEKEVRNGAIPYYRATSWTMLENSVASIPADIDCGAGRSFELPEGEDPQKQIPAQTRANSTDTEKNMSDKNDNGQPATPAVDAPVVRSKAELAADEVNRWGVQLKNEDLAAEYLRECVVNGTDPSKDGFFARVKAAQPPTTQVPPAPAAEEAARQGAPRVELARSIPRYGAIENFKGDGKEERAFRFGMWLLGRALYDPSYAPCAAARKFCEEKGLITRAMGESVNETGGYTVPPEFGNDLIDLREQFGVFRRNAKMVPMASDTRTDPRRVTGLTAYFTAEAGAITASDMGWDQVELVAKKLAVLARYSSEVSEDSILNFGDTLAGEIAYAFAEKEDQCGFNGDGTSTYGGIVGVRNKLLNLSATRANIAGLQVGSGNAFSELVLGDFEGVVARLPQYADTDAAAWFVHRSFYWNVMVKLLLASGGVTAAEIEDARKQRFMGYRVEFSQVMPKAEANDIVVAVLGDLSKAASFGTRRDTQIAFSEHSRFANDQIEIRGTERFDIVVHSVGNATSTAADQVAGPVTGLLMAAS